MQDSLPAGGLRLCREGVEPSGSLRKVSGSTFHSPFQDLPCRKGGLYEGDQLEFEIEIDRRGKSAAVNLIQR
jgi:hypothetical protein